MDEGSQSFRKAERAWLESEGVDAAEQTVKLERLNSTLRVLVAGDGPPVLFVPGAMSTGVVFAGLIRRLPGFRCIMIDRPGVGLSPPLPSQPTDIAAHKVVGDSLLVDILDGMDIEQSHVVSTSLGGWYTFRSAAAHPDRFMRICAMAFQVGAELAEAPLSMRMPVPKPLLPRRLKVGRRAVRAVLKGAGMKPTFDKGKFTDEGLDYVVALMRHTESFRNESLYTPRPVHLRGPASEIKHSAELLARVVAPVHLFWGTDDLFGGAKPARDFAAQLPNAELQMVEGAGHAPWLDEPELAAEAAQRHFGV